MRKPPNEELLLRNIRRKAGEIARRLQSANMTTNYVVELLGSGQYRKAKDVLHDLEAVARDARLALPDALEVPGLPIDEGFERCLLCTGAGQAPHGGGCPRCKGEGQVPAGTDQPEAR